MLNHMVKSMFSFIKTHKTIVQSGCTILSSHPAMYKASFCSISSLTFDLVSALEFDHSNRSVVVSHCCFDLHFSDNTRCGVSFHMFIFHLHIFFDEISVKIFGTFYIQVICFLTAEFKSVWYISYNNPLSDVSIANISPQFVTWFLLLFRLYFAEQKFLILVKFNSPIIFSWNFSLLNLQSQCHSKLPRFPLCYFLRVL